MKTKAFTVPKLRPEARLQALTLGQSISGNVEQGQVRHDEPGTTQQDENPQGGD